MKNIAIVIALIVMSGTGGCSSVREDRSTVDINVPIVVTEDIQAGIEKHIDAQASLGGGYFKLPFKEQELHLKLVRVHTEYLANLGPRRQFACVDLAHTDGNVYDVDFFLSGDPGDMTVTETTVHKINGKPLYAWEQRRNKTWYRVPQKGAHKETLGIKTGEDEFKFIYNATLPEMSGKARMWIPLPSTDRFQTVDIESMILPGEHQVLRDEEHGNRVLFLELNPEDSGRTIELRMDTRRFEKRVYAESAAEAAKYLTPERLVPLSDKFKDIAAEVLVGKKGELVRARALYDHVIDRIKYMKFGEGWGQGNAEYACDAASGNCTDFHSYFIALARAAGIPARFAIGASIPSSRNEGGVDGYHCWAEFYAEDKWWPVDISEADKCSQLATYFFGHHPANRIEFSRGRDLVVEPGPESGPINFLAYPVLEVEGEPVRAKVKFYFTRG